MLDQLTAEELEQAARTDYEYAQYSRRDLTRQICASIMARRYLQSKGCPDRAVHKMKNTLRWRADVGVDDLRTAAADPDHEDHLLLHKFLSSKKLYVAGYDKAGRSTYVFVPRLVDNTESLEATVKGHVWTLEKAIACSRAADKTVNVVMDFAGFSASKNAPPLSVGKEILTLLRRHYVGHIHRIFLLNVPTAFLCLWKILSPFAGTQTREKIVFLNGHKQKSAVLGALYEPGQAASWMIPAGTRNRALDLEDYLAAPFDEAFDESPSSNSSGQGSCREEVESLPRVRSRGILVGSF
jgi:hypothetical protein